MSLTGIKETFEKHSVEDSKGIKVHFRLDESGLLRLDKVFGKASSRVIQICLLQLQSLTNAIFFKYRRSFRKAFIRNPNRGINFGKNAT